MKHTLWNAVVFFILVNLCNTAFADFIAVEGSLESPETFNHYVTLPVNFDDERDKKYPLLINYHGKGGKGHSFSDLLKVLKDYSPAKMGDNGDWDEALPFVVVSPQNNGPFASASDHNKVIDHALANYNIDSNHIYFTGLSLGGFGAWSAVVKVPNSVAAIIPVAGWGGIPNPSICSEVEHIAIWAFHGENDQTVKFNSGLSAVNQMNNRCNPVYLAKMTSYPNTGHGDNAWGRTYRNLHGDSHTGGDDIVYNDIYWWLLSFGRDGSSYIDSEFPNPFNSSGNLTPMANAGSDQAVQLPINSLTLVGGGQDNDGTVELYVWEQLSGPVLSIIDLTSEQLILEGLVEGSYSFRLTVTDNEGAIGSDEVTVTVLPEVSAPTDPIFIDFGRPRSVDLNVNRINTFDTDFALKTKAGIDSGIIINVTGFSGTDLKGTTSSNVPEGITFDMSRDSFYGNDVAYAGKVNPLGVLVLTGLNPDAFYTLSVYASRMTANHNRQTHYRVIGQSVEDLYLDVHYNVSETVVTQALRSDVNGNITIEVEKGPENVNGYGFFYLGAMILEEQ